MDERTFGRIYRKAFIGSLPFMDLCETHLRSVPLLCRQPQIFYRYDFLRIVPHASAIAFRNWNQYSQCKEPSTQQCLRPVVGRFISGWCREKIWLHTWALFCYSYVLFNHTNICSINWEINTVYAWSLTTSTSGTVY